MPPMKATSKRLLSGLYSCLVPALGEFWAGPGDHRGGPARPGPATLSVSCLLRKWLRPHDRKPSRDVAGYGRGTRASKQGIAGPTSGAKMLLKP